MVRFSLILLAVLVFAAPARATLVALAPSAEGVAVAADSRMTFMGAACDGEFKILELARPARTVVVTTGDSIFVAPPQAHTADVCRYLATAPRLLDIGAVARDYLEWHAARAAGVPLHGLAAACVRAVVRFRRSHPGALAPYAGRTVFSVIVASYDPASRTATLRNFVVRIDARSGARAGRVEAARMATTVVGARSPRGVWIYGETAYVERYVYEGFGRRFLTASTLAFIRERKPVGETTLRQAAAAAVNVIQAASRATETVPAPSGIGGAIRVVLLGRRPHPQPLPPPWAAQ